MEATIGLDCTEAIPASAKTGIGIKEILEVTAATAVAAGVASENRYNTKTSNPKYNGKMEAVAGGALVFATKGAPVNIHSRIVGLTKHTLARCSIPEARLRQMGKSGKIYVWHGSHYDTRAWKLLRIRSSLFSPQPCTSASDLQLALGRGPICRILSKRKPISLVVVRRAPVRYVVMQIDRGAVTHNFGELFRWF